MTCTYIQKVQHKGPGHLACKALIEPTRATLGKVRHPAKTMSPVGHPPGCLLRLCRTLHGRAPVSAVLHSRRGREPTEAERRSGLTQFANQLLTKMHGLVRIAGDGYGRELTNAQ